MCVSAMSHIWCWPLQSLFASFGLTHLLIAMVSTACSRETGNVFQFAKSVSSCAYYCFLCCSFSAAAFMPVLNRKASKFPSAGRDLHTMTKLDLSKLLPFHSFSDVLWGSCLCSDKQTIVFVCLFAF